jgi:glutaredoxin-dependent peroxiredoxin
MSVRTGDKAPAFALPAKPGEVVNVGEHLGRDKVVLLFFPLAFSSVCTKEMCHLRDDWSKWEKLGARVFGISVDSPFVTQKFREQERIPFPILSDFNKDVARQYGVLYEDLMGLRGVAKRSAFVIGEDGAVMYDWVSEDAGKEPPYEEIRAALAA